MIVRRVQITGRSSYIVSLPKEWVKSVGVTRGSKVFIDILPDNSLRIRPDPIPITKNTSKIINLSAVSSFSTAVREVISAYVAGYESVKVVFDEERQEWARKLRDIVEGNILGFNTIDESPNSYTLYSVVNPESVSMKDALTREARLAVTMIREARKGIMTRDANLLELVVERDQIVDKLYLLINRQLTQALMGAIQPEKLGLSSHAEALPYFVAAKSIERSADHATIIASNGVQALKAGVELPTELLNLVEEAGDVFEEATRALIHFKLESAWNSASRIESIQARLDLMDGEGGRAPEYLRIFDSVKRIVGYSLDIVEAVIDLNSLKGMIEMYYA